MPRNSILVPQLKYKFDASPMFHSQSDHIINTHTHKTSEKLHVSICPGTTSIPVYRPKYTFDLKNSNLDMLAFTKN